MKRKVSSKKSKTVQSLCKSIRSLDEMRLKIKNKTKSFAEASQDLIFIIENSKRILYANEVCLAMLRVKEKDVIGKTLKDIFPDEIFKTMCASIDSVVVSGEPATFEDRMKIGSNDVWLNTRLIPVEEPNGEVSGVLGISRDITTSKISETKIRESCDKLQLAFEGIIKAMVRIVEIKDPYTAGHQKRVAQLAGEISLEMKLPEDKINGICIASVVHDIGKIYVPTEILSKPSLLSDVEFNIIKIHPQASHDILKIIEFPYPIAQIVMQHHERLDGSGYPEGLKGRAILLEARILAVADVVEAMSSMRPYRSSIGLEKALEEIKNNRGILYDPEVVDACLKVFENRGFKFE